ncbi:response regulator [Nitrospira sp. Nam74]
MAERLLIIDDSPNTIALLRATFKAAGYQVHGVMDGVYGIKEALACFPGLIILDICFPTGGGLLLLQRFKNNLRTKAIPVLSITSLEDEEVEKQAFECGAAGYLLKLIELEEVVQEVNRLLALPLPPMKS